MDRNIEKLIKIECPGKIIERKIEPIKKFQELPTLELIDIEAPIEHGISVHVDLGLDQLEEQED